MRALFSDRPNCSHNVSQKVKRIMRVSDVIVQAPNPVEDFVLACLHACCVPIKMLKRCLRTMLINVVHGGLRGMLPIVAKTLPELDALINYVDIGFKGG